MKPWSFLFLSFLIPAFSYPQDTLTLQNAMQKALEQNHRIEMARHQLAIAKNKQHIGNAGLLPKLELRSSGNYSRENTMQEFAGGIPDSEISGAETQTANASIDLNYTLFDGMGRINTYKKLKAQRAERKAQARATSEDVLMQLVTGYYELARAQGQYRIAEENTELSKERLQRLKNRYEYGKADKVQVLNAQVDLDSDSSTLLQADLDRKKAARTLNVLMGREPQKEIAVRTEVSIRRDLEKDSLLQRAMNGNARLARVREKLRVAEFDRKIVSAGNYPDLSLSGSYSYSRSESDAGIMSLNESDGLNAGITFSFPIFNGFQQDIQEKNARIRVESSKEELAKLEKEIRRDLLNAWQNYEMRLRMLRMEERNLVNAEKNFQRSQESYRVGRINATRFREAQINLIQARIRKLNSKYQAKTAEMRLLKLSGSLKEENGLDGGMRPKSDP